jgi:hypothetical protein
MSLVQARRGLALIMTLLNHDRNSKKNAKKK